MAQILIDLDDEIVKLIGEEAAENDRSRKAHVQHIVKKLYKDSLDKE